VKLGRLLLLLLLFCAGCVNVRLNPSLGKARRADARPAAVRR
jgi:hypothetical protein